MSKLYSHAFDIAFYIETPERDGCNISGAQLRAAILRRLQRLSDHELEEAVGAPYDTGEVGS